MGKHIAECGHNAKMYCHAQPERKRCPRNCERQLNCGHKCLGMCRDPCTMICKAPVRVYGVRGLCGHDFVIVPCFQRSQPVDKENLQNFSALCDAPCDTLLKCGDLCTSTCSKCWHGRFHEPCQVTCGSVSICGHR